MHLRRLASFLLAASIVAIGPAPTVARAPAAPDPVLSGAALPGANGLALDESGRLWVASTGGSRISALDPATGEVLEQYGPDEGVAFPEDLAFGPDGSLYWTGFLTGDIGRITPSGDASVIANVGPGANPITFTADGRLFVGRCLFGDGLYEVDPSGATPVRVVAEGIGAGCGINGMDVGPDGRIYGPQPFLSRIVAIDVDSGDLEVIATGFGPTLFAVDVDAAGDLLAVDGPFLRRVDPDTGSSVVEAVFGFLPDNLVVEDDGRIFVSSVNTAEVVEVGPGGVLRTVSAGGLLLPKGVALHGARTDERDLLVATSFGVEIYPRGGGAQTGFIQAAIPNAVSSLSAEADRWVTASPFGGNITVFDPIERSARVAVTGLDYPLDAVFMGDDVIVAEGGAGRVVRVSLADPTDRQVLLDDGGAPAGLALRGSDLFVSDIEGGRVLQVLDDGAPIQRVVAQGLDRPQALAPIAGGLLVVETGAGRITALLTNGRVVAVGDGLTPANPPLPGRPTDGLFAGIAVDRQGNAYVADPLTNRVLRYDGIQQRRGM